MRILLTKQREEWHNWIKAMPSEVQDIHFWPEMMFPYEVTGRGQGGLLVDDHESGKLILPLLKKDGNFYHPFNFGGPVCTPEYRGKPRFHGPIYCTLNPFFTDKQQKLLPVTEYQKESVWIDPTKPIKLRATTRHAVTKAEKHGANFRMVEINPNTVSIFTKMYETTMVRKGAEDYWNFDNIWFGSFFANLEGHVTLCFVEIDDEPECGAVLLHSYGTCYYHFSSSFNRKPTLGLNHYMVAKICDWAKEMKFKRLHLGGGVQRHDGLYTFKRGFSDLTLPVYKYSPNLLAHIAERTNVV